MSTVIDQILEQTNKVFESAWAKELDRLAEILTQAIKFSEGVMPYEMSEGQQLFIKTRLKSYDKEYLKLIRDKRGEKGLMHYYCHVFCMLNGKFKEAKDQVYITASNETFGNAMAHSLILYKTDKLRWATQCKELYRESLHAKLISQLEKKITDETAVHDIKVYETHKGYGIDGVLVNDKGEFSVMHTTCDGYGGYAVQRYHYRYKVRLEKNRAKGV